MLVVDASAIAELILGTSRGDHVAEQLAAASSLHAPHVLALEVGSVIQGLLLADEINQAIAVQAIADIEALGIEMYDHLPLLPPALRLRQNATVYDAAYLVLAEALDAPLLTCDRKLRDVPGCSAEVVLIDR